MGNDKFAKNPVLYIHQPYSEEIEVEMQYNYRTAKEEKRNEEKSLTKKDSQDSSHPLYRHTSDYKAGRETAELDKEKLKDKRLQEMTIEEQLVYLTEKPAYAPQVLCEVRTENAINQGVISDYEDGIVILRTHSGNIEIPKEKINHIRIVSF